MQPVDIKFSSVRSLSCISLKARRDVEGGISTFHIVLARWGAWPWGNLRRKSSSNVRSLELDRFQTILPSLCAEGTMTWLTIWFVFWNAACTETGTSHWKFEMKSLTFEDRECKVLWGKFKEIKSWVQHQGLFRSWYFPHPL